MLSDLTTVMLTAGTFILGGVATGAVGMGAALVVAPLLAIVEPALVPMVLPLALIWSNIAGWWTERNRTSWPRVGWWVAGSVPGWLAGVWLLTRMSAAHITVAVGGVGLVAVVLIAAQLQLPAHRTWWGAAGLLAGTAKATVGVNGPFVAPTVTGLQPQAARPTLLAYFLIGNCVTLGLWAASGLLGWNHVLAGLLGGPAAAIGVVLGAQLRRWVTRRMFTAAVAVLSAAAVVRAASQLL